MKLSGVIYDGVNQTSISIVPASLPPTEQSATSSSGNGNEAIAMDEEGQQPQSATSSSGNGNEAIAMDEEGQQPQSATSSSGGNGNEAIAMDEEGQQPQSATLSPGGNGNEATEEDTSNLQNSINNDIINIKNFYKESYKRYINPSFNLDDYILVYNLYNSINNDIRNNYIYSLNLVTNLLTMLQNPLLTNNRKNVYITEVSNNFPFLFYGVSQETDKYQYLINTLNNINNVIQIQPLIYNREDLNKNIIEAIRYREDYNRIISKYQLFLQHYKEGTEEITGTRTSQRITVLKSLIMKAHVKLSGGKKTKKNRYNRTTHQTRRKR